ncbi:MAG: NUDIX hydrolase [Magnetococcales bacterium]|nr:NUDIX hydrolase [Magnetococcales bacterium]
MNQAIAVLDRHVPYPSAGLPDPMFYFISRMTPLINVDLLIKDEGNRTLLAWRDDRFSGRGWHLPGGIIRFQERMETRLHKVIESEIGTTGVTFDPTPIAFNEIIIPGYRDRGHFISLLYRCYLHASFVPANDGLLPTSPGFLRWYATCPENLLGFHDIYRQFL